MSVGYVPRYLVNFPASPYPADSSPPSVSCIPAADTGERTDHPERTGHTADGAQGGLRRGSAQVDPGHHPPTVRPPGEGHRLLQLQPALQDRPQHAENVDLGEIGSAVVVLFYQDDKGLVDVMYRREAM